jgi:hypothetical protein
MKIFTILLISLTISAAFGQSGQSQQDKQLRREMEDRNGFPPPLMYPTTPGIFDQTKVNQAASKPRIPVIIAPSRGPSKEEKEELTKQAEEIRIMRQPHPEDVQNYSTFLQQKNTGLFRLFPDLGCESKYTVKIADNCSNLIYLSKSYSLIRRDYGDDHFYDLRLKNEELIFDGFLSQSIISAIGDIPLGDITLQTRGMRFLKDFNPETTSKKAKEQFVQISRKITSEGLVYGKVSKLYENVTYLTRIIAYQSSNKNLPASPEEYKRIKTEDEKLLTYLKLDNRRDKIIAFRIVRKDNDGSITILWKELADKKSPRLKFEKDEKITDLKVQ